jgi:hypothetical protein
VSFTELATPTLIGVAGGEPATGTFWLDPSSGRVLRSELHVVSRSNGATASATFTVRYAFDAKTQLTLPTLMQERYMVQGWRGAPETIEGTATYSNPRRFTVTTDKLY